MLCTSLVHFRRRTHTQNFDITQMHHIPVNDGKKNAPRTRHGANITPMMIKYRLCIFLYRFSMKIEKGIRPLLPSIVYLFVAVVVWCFTCVDPHRVAYNHRLIGTLCPLSAEHCYCLRRFPASIDALLLCFVMCLWCVTCDNAIISSSNIGANAFSA